MKVKVNLKKKRVKEKFEKDMSESVSTQEDIASVPYTSSRVVEDVEPVQDVKAAQMARAENARRNLEAQENMSKGMPKSKFNLKAKLQFQLTKKHKYILLSIGAVVLITVGTFLTLEVLNRKKFVPFDLTQADPGFIGKVQAQTNLSTPPEVRDKENPVNGVMVTSKELKAMQARKLVVVSLNNHSDARPQFGLSKADLVLEVLAEGGITRYNAFYYQDQTVKKVGPIRSARSYMLEFFLGFDDPVFVHEGQASYPPQERAVPEINTLRHFYEWGVESMQTAGSRYRDPERIRSAGYVHSLMTGFDLINKEVDRLGWKKPSNITPLKFKFDAPEEERQVVNSASKIEIKFSSIGGSAYYAKFDYDKVTNTYLRSIGGEADVDALSGDRIAPKNVIVEYHDYRDAMDGHSRIIIDMIGEGEVFVFRDGQMIKGKWKKASRTERTKYYDETGAEIEFNRGQIWVVNAIRTSSHKVTDMFVNDKLTN